MEPLREFRVQNSEFKKTAAIVTAKPGSTKQRAVGINATQRAAGVKAPEEEA
jgi:hypothetical protein